MFPENETSRTKGTPVDLYFFRYGQLLNSYYAYTNALRPVTFDGIVYEPVAISRDAVKSSGSLDKSELRINAARDISMGVLFRAYPPSRVVTLIIRQGHLDDPDSQFLVAWAGRLLSFEREGSESIMTAQPISTSLRRSGLRRHYQITCPHYLYGDDCRANRAVATVPAVVQSLTAYGIVLTTGWNAQPTEKYRQGEIRWLLANGETQIRTIIRTTGANTLTLSGPTSGLAAGDSVDVSLGCNHETSKVGDGLGDCTNLHVQEDGVTPNGPNFGGCKWIPKKNPIGIVNGFY